METIIIYWMRWTWKSTIWRSVAESLWYIFVDLDSFIEKEVWMKLEKYISIHAWDNFRDIEHESLKKVLEIKWKKVISLGWWTIIFERNIQVINKILDTKKIFLETDISIIEKRISLDEKNNSKRNSLTWNNVINELKSVYKEREVIYKDNADFVVENNWKIENAVSSIITILNASKICIPIINFDDKYIEKKFSQLNEINEIGYVELRIDYLKDLSKLDDIIMACPKKTIITNRIEAEWWKFWWDLVESLSIQKKALKSWAYLIDIELEVLKNINCSEINLEKTIISSHNFKNTPKLEELVQILNEMKEFNPQVYKIAVTPNNPQDVKVIYILAEYFKKNFIWKDFIFISMWELWKETRKNIIHQWWLLSFATFWWNSSAPWQLNYKELLK